MTARPLFSVVIPVFNRARAVLPALLSVQAQDFADFECLVIDDGSADGAALAETVQALADSRFRYVRRDNGGGGAARNTGIEMAKGEFIAFLDSDDVFLPGKLRRDAEMASSTSDPRAVWFSPVRVDRGGNAFWIKPSRGPKPGEAMSEYLTCGQGFAQTSTLVLGAALARSVRFAEGLPFGQDTDFAMRLAARGARFTMLAEPLVIWNDSHGAGRVSAGAPHAPMLQWLEAIRPQVSPRAYLAYRGWHIARLAAPSDLKLALALYGQALVSGALPPKLALTALCQILLPRPAYRAIADRVVSAFGVRRKR